MPQHVAATTHRSRATTALVVGLVALIVFLLLVRVAAAPAIDAFDLGVERWSAAHRLPWLYGAFDVVSRVCGLTGMRIIGFVGAALLFLFRSRVLGIGMLAVVLAGMQAFEIAKCFIARPRPAHGYALDPTFAFPSGHATLSAAVCGTLAYVLWREQLLSGPAATGAGIALPILVGISRVYLDMHWATDVAGGWLAGLVIACAAAAAYERTLTRTNAPR